MGKDIRVHYRRRHPYATKSNRRQIFRTPGGRIGLQYIKKRSKGPRCGDCKISLPGIKHLTTQGYKSTKQRERTVSRAYGGSRCAKCVRSRIVRAFLIEEQKIVKKVLNEKKKEPSKPRT